MRKWKLYSPSLVMIFKIFPMVIVFCTFDYYLDNNKVPESFICLLYLFN